MENEQIIHEAEVKESAPVHSELTGSMIDSVKGMGPWMRFFSILGFVGVGFMMVFGFAMLVLSVTVPAKSGNLGMSVVMLIVFSVHIKVFILK